MENQGSASVYLGSRNDSIAGVVPFRIAEEDRLRHLHIVGQTGTGKTTFLKRLAIDDIQAGRGVAFVDPHGDAARELLEYIPPERRDDVVYFEPANLERPLGLNLLQSVAPDDRDLVTQNVVGTFRYLWADSWGARMDYIFKNTIRALLDSPSRTAETLLGLPRMYTDPTYRDRIVHHSTNPEVRSFWLSEFSDWNTRQRSEYTAPILNKVGQFLMSDVLRNILGQTMSTIDLAHIMDNRRILIANLDKGAIGGDDANILGSLLVTGFQLAALKRSRIPETDRVPFFFYLDEFHSFTTGSFTSILSESRKYKLALTLAHQYLAQMHPEVRSAVFGNCGSLVCFRVGAEDAADLAEELQLPQSALEDLSRGAVAVRLLEGGDTHSFLGETFPPEDDTRCGIGEGLISYSQNRFTRDRSEVEARILKWLEQKKAPRVSRG